MNVLWEWEETPCLLCGSTAARPLLWRQRPRHVVCRECGLVYQNPRPTVASIQAYYERGYWEDRGSADDARHDVSQQRGAAIAALARNVIGKDDLIVEVGCGHGKILAYVRDQFACQALGVEPSLAQCAAARERFGLELIQGGLDDLDLGGRKAKLLILSHVLEHFHEPRAALARCRAALADDGWIFVEVPSILCPHPAKRLSTWLSIEHMVYFSLTTLSQMLAETGFRVTATESSTFVRAFAQNTAGLPQTHGGSPAFNEYWPVRRALLRHEIHYWPRYAAQRAVAMLSGK